MHPGTAAINANSFGLIRASADRLSLLLHSPKRSHSEPGKRQGETNCNQHPPRSYSSCLESCIFVRQRDAAKASHREENKPCYLKPELVQDASERSRSSTHRRSNCADCATAFGTLSRQTSRYSGSYSQLSRRGNLAHGLDFNRLWRYNDAAVAERTVRLRSASKTKEAGCPPQPPISQS